MEGPNILKDARQQLREFNEILKETDAIYDNLAKQSGLSDCAFWIMYALRDSEGECTQKELCEQWTFSKQTVNSAIKNLEKNGYIVLTASNEDKRSKHIRLNEQGILFAKENIDFVFRLEELALLRMSPSERIAMVDLNRTYQAMLQTEANHYLKSK